METAVARRAINPQPIDPHHYFISLLTEARRSGLISAEEYKSLQDQLMGLLKNLVHRYNSGNSTSIKVESAESLLISLLYVLNIRFQAYPQPEAAITALVQVPLREHYQIGVQLILSRVEEARLLYREVMQTRIDTELVAYNATIDEAIPDFFAVYDHWYQAHDTPTSIDYQLARTVDINLTGVSYIYEYLQHLLIENRFCKLFPGRDISRLLANYGQKYRIDYPEYLLNIFEIVLTNVILAEVLAKEAKRLNFFAASVGELYLKFQGKNENQINSMLYSALNRLVDRYGLNQQLSQYIREWLPQLLPRLHLALAEHVLEQLFITDQEPPLASQLINLEPGINLDDEEFRIIVECILDCSSPQDKVSLVLNQVHSWSDFYDILAADCLFGEEYTLLFAALGDLELSLLTREVGTAVLREDIIDLKQLLINLTEFDREWECQLVNYINTLDSDRISLIVNLMKSDLQIIN